ISTHKTVQEVINAALVDQNLHSALLSVAGNDSGLLVSNRRLGWWLKRVEGKIVNKLRLIRAGSSRGYPLWKLEVVQSWGGFVGFRYLVKLRRRNCHDSF